MMGNLSPILSKLISDLFSKLSRKKSLIPNATNIGPTNNPSRCLDTSHSVLPGAGTFEFFPLDRPFPLPLLQTFPNNQEMDRKKYMKDVLRWKERA